jgi:two-component system, NarL family, invasion response regulator UvrY
MKIKVLIADDHAVVREGIRKILSEYSDLVVGGEARDGNEAMNLIRNGSWDVVILDMTMPGKNGFDILKDIHAEKPGLPVLILSMLPEEQFARRALKAGASGYLTKGSDPGELIKAIRKILSGGKYISLEFAEQLAYDLHPLADKDTHEILSDREFQVMLKLAEGKSISEIAKQLFLSAKTVTTYRARIMEKMNMKSNAEVTRYVIEHHLNP